MIPLLAGPHLSFLADILGVPLSAYRQIHHAGGMISFFLLIFHALTVIATRTAFPLRATENTWGVIVSRLSFPSPKVNA
jgi:hypothetical protein